ncbi:MAG: AEC family transporter [Hyphomonadaceae bacterium]
MLDVVVALAPVFILILIGWGARSARILPDEAWGAVNRFGYLVLYPAFLFTTVAGANLTSANAPAFLAAAITGFLIMAAFAFATRFFIRNDDPAFTSVFQGAVRWNGFALLAAADGLYGPGGAAMVALAFGPLVLIVNLISVGVLARFGAGQTVSTRAIAAQILANPLILACAAGLIVNLLGFHDFGVATSTLELLGQAAMPIALVCVGAGLEFGPLRRNGALIGLSSALKLIAGPAVLFACALLYRLDPVSAAICAGIGSTSTAAASYTLAREMGGDARLMAGIVTATTILSFLTMPVAIALTR